LDNADRHEPERGIIERDTQKSRNSDFYGFGNIYFLTSRFKDVCCSNQ